jgi:hypothetical protein
MGKALNIALSLVSKAVRVATFLKIPYQWFGLKIILYYFTWHVLNWLQRGQGFVPVRFHCQHGHGVPS